jgi:hypothetical protein
MNSSLTTVTQSSGAIAIIGQRSQPNRSVGAFSNQSRCTRSTHVRVSMAGAGHINQYVGPLKLRSEHQCHDVQARLRQAACGDLYLEDFAMPLGNEPAPLDTLTIRPYRFLCISGMNALHKRHGPSNVSIVVRTNSTWRVLPALSRPIRIPAFTRIPTWPRWDSIRRLS